MRRSIAVAVALAIVVIASGIALGSLRYRGVDGLYRRVHAEVAARQPHPLLAPTPLPISEIESPTSDPTLVASRTSTDRLKSATIQPSLTSARAQPRTPVPLPASATPRATATIISPTSLDPLRAPRQTSQVTPQPETVPPSIRLNGLTHMWQTWNNCGPATLAMNLSYFGQKTSQADVAAGIRPNKEDKNVSPDELAAFARAQGLQAIARVNGTPDHLRQLLASGIPVLVETWHEPKPNDGMGHYRLLTGYDDAGQVWIAYDSYDATGVDRKKPYTGIRIPYDELGPLWKVFNRQYVVIYTPALADQVRKILGHDLDEAAMWQHALVEAQTAVKQDAADAFAWFNLGSDLTALGRYAEAAQAFDQARTIGLPWRMFWYQFSAFQAYDQAGRYEEVIALADATIRTAKYVEELYYWRGLAQQAQAKTAEARHSFEQALEMNRNYVPAAEALAALPAP